MINFKILNNEIDPPKRMNGNAFDLRATLNATIYPQRIIEMPLGVSVEVDENCCSLLLPRSGLGKQGLVLANTLGLIDYNYRGEIVALLQNRNIDGKPILISKNDRVAQLLIVRVSMEEATFKEVLSTTTRGSDGFGSTGV